MAQKKKNKKKSKKKSASSSQNTAQTQQPRKAASKPQESEHTQSPKKARENTEDAFTPPDKEGKDAAAPAPPRRIRSFLFQLGLILLVYLGVTGFQNLSMLKVGQAAPAFHLKTFQGKDIDSSRFKGKRVILHFWTTWCSVCKYNIPVFRMLSSSYRDDPVFLSVVTDGHHRKALAKLMKEKKINYPVLLASPQMARQYKVSRYPSTYFIDSKGRISSKDSGFLTPFGLWWRSLWVRVKSWLV